MQYDWTIKPKTTLTLPLETCLVTLYGYLFLFFQFQFVNSFMALFYTAFVLQDMDKLKEVLFIYNTEIMFFIHHNITL